MGTANREAQGQQYYKDIHLLRANGYAPATDIAKSHRDIEDSLRMREGNKWGQWGAAGDLGKTLNDPKAYKSVRQRKFEYNVISNSQSLAKEYL